MGRQVIVPGIFAMVLAFGPATAHGWSYSLDKFIITDHYIYGVSVGGDFVVWLDGMAMDLYGYDLSIREEFIISPNDVDSMSLSIGGDFVVWREMTDPDLYGYNMLSRKGFTVPAKDVDSMSISNNGNFVIWKEMASGGLHAYNLATKQQFTVDPNDVGSTFLSKTSDFVVWTDMMKPALYGCNLASGEQLTISTSDIDSMSISNNGNFVTWKEMTSGGLYAYNPATKQQFTIDPNDVGSTFLSETSDFVVWTDMMRPGLYGCNLASKEQFTVSTSDIDSMNIYISGNFVIWEEMMDPGLRGYDLSIKEQFTVSQDDVYPLDMSDDFVLLQHYMYSGLYGYDLSTRGEFNICTFDIDTMTGPFISGDFVVWSGINDPNDKLYGALIYRVPNDNCTDAIEVAEDIPYNGDTTGAAGVYVSSCAHNDTNDVWHFYEPMAGGNITISTDGSTFDTTLSVFNACDGTELACNDDYSLDNTQSRVGISVVRGKTYFIRVAGFDGQTGSYQLLVTRGACAEPIKSDLNDDCKVDMFDLAIMASEWMVCNLRP